MASITSPTKHASIQFKQRQQQQQQQQQLAELDAILEDLTLEADSRLRTMRSHQESHLATIARTYRSAIDSLPPQIRSMLLGEFIDRYQGNTEVAVRAMVEKELKVKPITMAEQDLRTRKRAAPNSPVQQRSRRIAEESNDEDVFATNRKRVKGDIGPMSASSRSASRPLKESASASKPTRSTRATRPRGGAAASDSEATLASASTSNFIYRSRPSTLLQNPRLPPTPLIGKGRTPSSERMTMNGMVARRPRRGESIVMMSINDSPLGVGFAGEDNEEDAYLDHPAEDDANAEGGEQEEEEQEADQWDLMNKDEASGEVKIPKGNGRLQKPPPVTKTSTRHSTRSAPNSNAFIPPSNEFTFTLQLQQLGAQLANPATMTAAERSNAQAQLRKLLALI